MNHKPKNGSPFLIGIFVLSAIFIAISVIIWLGANQFLKERVFYVTYIDGSVEGIEKGSAVKYQGVPCGKVDEIKVAPDGKLVEIIMQIDPKITINERLRVRTTLAGLAGGKFLELHYPENPEMATMHPTLNFKKPYPVINSAPSSLAEISIAAQRVMNNLMLLKVNDISEGTIKFLNSTTSFFDSDTLKRILYNLQESSKRLDNVLAQAENSVIIENSEQTTQILMQTADRLKLLSDNLIKQADDMKLPEYIQKIYLGYDSTIANTNKMINNVGYRTESTIFSLQETLEELRKTSKALRNTLNSINDSPSTIFLTSPPPTEK